MSTRWRWAILGGGLGLYLLGLGFLGGIAAERVRFDHQRLAVLNRYDQALKNWHAYLMGIEKGVPAAAEATIAEDMAARAHDRVDALCPGVDALSPDVRLAGFGFLDGTIGP